MTLEALETPEGKVGLNFSNHNRSKTIFDSSFFKERRASTLPTPAEVRAINEKSGDYFGTDFRRPPPVKFPSLGLIVKYGSDPSVTEAETQNMVYQRLKGKVPIPEVFGWIVDGDQTFIYMALIEGETLEQRWHALNEEEREAVCKELNSMAKAWRSLEPPNFYSPAYWEYYKAHRVRARLFDDEMEEEWNTKYLPTILDPVDDEPFYHPWLWFVLSKGI